MGKQDKREVITERVETNLTYEQIEAALAEFTRQQGVPVEMVTRPDGSVEIIINNCKSMLE
ncbi:MAG: hypothetical protein PVS3B3_31190 [Ktedonobacteraceae bacterium]